MDGYQGVRSASCLQRQSAASRSSRQTGRAIALAFLESALRREHRHAAKPKTQPRKSSRALRQACPWSAPGIGGMGLKSYVLHVIM